jgi:UDP-N-acetylmuramyl tripeptide synthase
MRRLPEKIITGLERFEQPPGRQEPVPGSFG